MPTYEYKCVNCGNKFEYFQTMREKPLSECPKCSSPVKRLIGRGAGIIFKGAGFYANDYKPKKQKAKADTCAEKGKDNPACQGCPAKADADKKV